MKLFVPTSISFLALLASAAISYGEIKVTAERNDNERATPEFKFPHVPSPAKNDAAAKAKIILVDGAGDPFSGELGKLNDGKLPTEADQPEENFFFNAGTEGGRLQVDLGSAVEIKQVNTYSWHPTTRGPQVYKLYGSDGTAEGFNAKPKNDIDPEKCGWKLITGVDTGPEGGQHGVSISNSEGAIGKYRYLLFAVKRTESDDDFGNTFYSEIDVVTPVESVQVDPDYKPFVTNSVDGKCEITIDTGRAPDLTEWADQKLAPVLTVWYPKLTEMLASDGYTAPTKFKVTIAPGNGVAATGGNGVTANATWLRRELNREAIGALLHEEVHVVQNYGWGRRRNPGATRAPGWLTEAIPDYIRWFIYEPNSHGADLVWIKKQRNFNPKYDTAYRPGANFLNWASEKYDKNLVSKLNAAIRSGKYSEDVWKESTGKTADELGAEWKEYILKELSPAQP